MSPEPAIPPRLLFLQHDSIFENYGGVQYYLDDLLTLAASAYGSSNIHAVIPQRTALFNFQKRPYHLEIVRLAQKGILKKFSNRYSLKYLAKAKAECGKFKPQLIIASHISLAPLAYAISKTTGIPFIVIAYGIEAWGNYLPQDKWALKNADGILSISHWTKQILEKQGFPSKKIQVIHPAMTQDFSELPYLPKERAENTPLRLLTVGRLSSEEQYKGQDHVLEALKHLKERKPTLKVEYTIQGEGNDLSRLKNLVETYQLTNQVHFLPAVKDRKALIDIFYQHDLFVMPARFGKWRRKWKGEGFGIVYVEAGACGLPSLAYDCGGATDIIQNGKTGFLVAPDSIEALTKVILECAEQPAKLAKLGKDAYSHVIGEFSPSAILKEIKLAFARFLETRPKSKFRISRSGILKPRT